MGAEKGDKLNEQLVILNKIKNLSVSFDEDKIMNLMVNSQLA